MTDYTSKAEKGQGYSGGTEIVPVDDHFDDKHAPVDPNAIQDEVFGEINADGPQFRSLSFWGAVMVMTKLMIGLGVISIPFLFMVVGLVPGVIMFLFFAIAITWCNYTVGDIKLRHPDVYYMDDIGYKMGGKVGKEVLAACATIYYVVISGSGMLGISIAFNALSSHGACTAVFVAVACILVCAISSVRTLGKISLFSWVGVISIFVAVFTLMIATAVQERPAAAPQTGPWDKDLVLFGAPTWAAAGSTVGGFVYTLAGSSGFIASEMKDPTQFGKCSLIAMTTITIADIMIGIVVYYYCGQYVTSPSPGSAGPLMKKVAYGLALPGIIVSTVLFTHMAAKYIFVRSLRGTRHLANNTWQHWATWMSCTIGVSLVAYVVGSGIPIFSSLSSLIGACFGPTVSFLPMGAMWLFDHWHLRKTNKTIMFRLKCLWAAFIVLTGFICQGLGTYGSIVDIKNGFASGAISKPWSCADNSNSS